MKLDFTSIKPNLMRDWTKEQMADYIIELMDEIAELKTYKELIDLC